MGRYVGGRCPSGSEAVAPYGASETSPRTPRLVNVTRRGMAPNRCAGTPGVHGLNWTAIQSPWRSNALVQLQARYNRCGEAAFEKCLAAATFVRWRAKRPQPIAVAATRSPARLVGHHAV